MAENIHDSSWDAIQKLRADIDRRSAEAESLVEAAQVFAASFAASFESVVLARVFVVVPANQLPPAERAIAELVATTAGQKLAEATPVLSLAGTAGIEPVWNERARSSDHRAIPLLSAAFVERAPMIAELLASLRVELVASSADAPVQLRQLPGGLNARFFVADAQAALDSRGRHVIAAREFVERYAIATVFGMGGSYVNGTLVAAIVFTDELLTAAEIDRFPMFITSFKTQTAGLVSAGKLFSADPVIARDRRTPG